MKKIVIILLLFVLIYCGQALVPQDVKRKCSLKYWAHPTSLEPREVEEITHFIVIDHPGLWKRFVRKHFKESQEEPYTFMHVLAKHNSMWLVNLLKKRHVDLNNLNEYDLKELAGSLTRKEASLLLVALHKPGDSIVRLLPNHPLEVVNEQAYKKALQWETLQSLKELVHACTLYETSTLDELL